MKCPKCQAENPEDAKFCIDCGAPLAEIDESGDKKVSARELRDKVRQVRSDPSFAQNAEKLCQTMRTYGGARQAAQLIEDFIIHV